MQEEFKNIRIAQEISIEAAPSQVFAALVQDTASWWGAPYVSVENCTDIVVESEVGGKFYELWGDAGGRLWGVVTQLKQDQLLEVTGPFCMPGAVHATVRFELEKRAGATLVKLTHQACGYISDEAKSRYAFGWKDLLGTRLKALVETGKKYGVGHGLPDDFKTRN